MDPLLAHPAQRIYDHIRTRVLVLQAGALLLLPPQEEGAWLPPGGGLESGETLQACAAREVFEETGLTVEVGPVAFLEQWIGTPGRPAGADFDLHVFFWASPVGSTRPRPERHGAGIPRFVPLAEVPGLPLYPTVLKGLAQDLLAGRARPGAPVALGRLEPPDSPPRPLA